jgi:hypothetical protein
VSIVEWVLLFQTKFNPVSSANHLRGSSAAVGVLRTVVFTAYVDQLNTRRCFFGGLNLLDKLRDVTSQVINLTQKGCVFLQDQLFPDLDSIRLSYSLKKVTQIYDLQKSDPEQNYTNGR